MTQETLEEASLLSRPIHLIWDEDERYDCNEEFREEFKKGAKWQQKRSYSKEEVNSIFYAICKHSFFEDNVETVYIQDVKDEFEQFKKK